MDLGVLKLGSLRDVATETGTAETTLDQQELDSRMPSTLADAIGTVPGVTLSNVATPQGSNINIRGLGADAGVYGSNTKVNVVVDGVSKGQEEIYRQGSLLSIEPELFKEVRVIRGPAESFRFSSGAIGGTVEAQTKDATDFIEDGETFAYRLKLGGKGGASNEWTASSILAFAPDDRFDALFFIGKRQAENYTDGSGTEQSDTEFNSPSGLLKLNYALSDDSKVTFSYSTTKNTLRDVDYNMIGGNFNTPVDADVSDETAFVEYRYDPAGNPFVNLSVKLTYTDELIANVSAATTSTIFNADNRTEKTALIVENEAYFDAFGASNTLLTGVEVGNRERTSISHTGVNAGASPGGTDKYQAFYITNEMDFGRLTLTPQLRFENQTITAGNNNHATDGTKYEASDWSGALAARFEVTDNWAVFGTAAYNTNLPIIDDIPVSTRTNPAFINTTEKARTFEIGASYDAQDLFAQGDTLAAKVTAFNTNIWDNTTYTNPLSSTSVQAFLAANTANPFFGITPNADRIESNGVEFELSYVNPAFYMDLNAARIRAKWADGTWFNNGPADTVQLTLGKRFMDEQLDLSMEIKHAWSTDRNVTTSFTGRAVTGVAAVEHQAWTTLDLNAAYIPNSGNLEGTEFRFGITNATDVAYQPYLSSRPAAGRTFRFSVARTF